MPLTSAPKASTAAPAVTSAPVLERLQYPLVAVFLVLFLIVGWVGREPTMNAAADDELVYLSLSKSLESGSYREIYKATAPLHVQYPPGYPAWLMVVRHTVGENLDLIRLSNLLLVALALLLIFLVARGLMGTRLALALLFLLALNRSLLTTGSLTSEGLFLLVSAAALALMLPSGRPDARRVTGVIALALFAFLTRAIGLALVLAVGAWLWSHRRRGPLLAWAASSVLVVGGWFTYSAIAREAISVRSYATEFARRIPASTGVLQHLAERVWHRGVVYATTIMPNSLSLPTIPGTLVDNWLWLVANAVCITAGFVVFWRRWRALALYLLCYLAMVLLWSWFSGRLLVPLIPFGLLALLLGARWATGLLPMPARKIALGALLVLLALGALQAGRERLSLYRQCDRNNPYGSPGCYGEAKLAMAAAGEYLRSHASPESILLTNQPASMNFLSSHPTEDAGTLLPAYRLRIGELIRSRNIRFILISNPWMARAFLSNCNQLRIANNLLPAALLLSTAEGGAAGSDACPALGEMVSQIPPE
jgi:hypothetical protein